MGGGGGGGEEEHNFKSLVVLFEEAVSQCFVVMVVLNVGTDCTCTNIHTSDSVSFTS